MASSVALTKMVEKMNLKNVTPEVDLSQIRITVPDINRAALQLAGYFEHFTSERVQIIGYVEYTYLMGLPKEEKLPVYERFVSYKSPCIIYTTRTKPEEELLQLAIQYGVPVFITDKETSAFSAELQRWLNVELAPCISIHGVLVDVYGEGVLIMGESGIGKSEAALELIRRGHMLVADDRVDCYRVHNHINGRSPQLLQGMLEIRGIGIINVSRMFGASYVLPNVDIDFEVYLEKWNDRADYDRVGIEEKKYEDILDIQIPKLVIPVREGRSMAVIIESAVTNFTLSEME